LALVEHIQVMAAVTAVKEAVRPAVSAAAAALPDIQAMEEEVKALTTQVLLVQAAAAGEAAGEITQLVVA
jgi:hypothetical protein